MKNIVKIASILVFLVIASGCTNKPVPIPYVIYSDGIIIEATDSASAVEIAKIMRLTSLEPVQHDELDCEKGPSHIRVKKNGSLQDSFDDLVNEGWDCVLILD